MFTEKNRRPRERNFMENSEKKWENKESWIFLGYFTVG
jgi:hypothetical protein